MRNMFIALGIVLAFGGCKKDKWHQALSDTSSFKDKMCACKDKACADDVHKKYKQWQEDFMKKIGDKEQPPKDVEEKADKIEQDMRKCRHKFDDTGATDTGAAPAAPAPAAPAAPGSGSAAGSAAPANP